MKKFALAVFAALLVSPVLAEEKSVGFIAGDGARSFSDVIFYGDSSLAAPFVPSEYTVEWFLSTELMPITCFATLPVQCPERYSLEVEVQPRKLDREVQK